MSKSKAADPAVGIEDQTTGQLGQQPVTEVPKATDQSTSGKHQSSSSWSSNISIGWRWLKDAAVATLPDADAATLLMQRAKQFEQKENWSEAGDAFSEAAEKFSQQGGNTIYEQANCYQNAANCFCKTDKPKAVHCFERAAQLYCEVGQFSIAARLMETAGELTEELARKLPALSTQNSSDPELSSFEFVSDANSMQEAINRYQKAADHFSAENSVASAASCRTKLAILLGDSGQFRDAANEFAKLGEEAQGHDLLQFGANDHMLKSCLCQLAMDLKACSKRADELAAKSESFARSDEFSLVKGLAAAISVEAFDKAVAEYQRFKFPKKLDEFDMRRITDARKSVQFVNSMQKAINRYQKAAELQETPLDTILFKNCASLSRDKRAFLHFSTEQKIFIYLLSKNVKESTHVEFKSSMMSGDINYRMLRSACSMYNGLQPDLREPSITDSSRRSSYVIYGIEEESRKSSTMRKNFSPLQYLKGEEEIQDLFNSSTLPSIEVYFHRVQFDADVNFKSVGCITKGSYGLLEIPAGECGPVYFKKRNSGKARADNLLLYTRSDAKNSPEEEWDQSMRERVFSQFKQRFDAKALYFVRNKLETAMKSFRVLILTKFSGVTSPADKEKLARALGRGKWEIIIDFDHESRKPGGHCALIEEEMNKQGRLYSLKACTELSEKIDISDLEECQRGDRTIYIQANGCTERSISVPKNPAKVKKLIRSNALEPVFERNVTPKPVLCLALFITATADEFLSSAVRPDIIPGLLKDAYESESGSSEEFQLITLYTNEAVKNSLKNMHGSESYVAPDNQIGYMLNDLSPSGCRQQDYELPGVSGVFNVTRETFACYKPYLRLYHIRAGEKGYLNLDEKQRESRAVELIREFLAGSELSREMLYFNEQLEYKNSNKRVYVKRREIERLKNRVKNALDHCKDRNAANVSVLENQIVRFPHDPLSGATTIARVVLWQLRQEYPCLEVKSMCTSKLKEIIEAVRLIFKASVLPVLILFDSHTVDFITVQTFVSELRLLTPSPQFVALFAEQVAPSGLDSFRQPSNSRVPVLTMELGDEETEAFTAIYDSVGGDVHFEKFATEVGDETECTPFLFGVWYFKRDYRRIKEFVELLLTDIDDTKKKLLFVASMVQRFTHAPLDLAIAAHCVGLSPAQGDPSWTLAILGKQRHLLTVQKHTRVFGFAPVFVVGNFILECLFREIADEEKETKEFGAFIDDICGMAECSQLLPCLQKLVQDLITCDKRLLDPRKLFTDFIMSILNLCTSKKQLSWTEVEDVFIRLAKTFSEKRPHILIHCARLFSYGPHDYEKSLELVRKALDLKDDEGFIYTQCNDDVVLGLSAHLINCRLNSGKPLPFRELERLACESIELCHKAQNKRRGLKFNDGEFRAHPYCNEIQAQRVLLNKFFSEVCDGKTEAYFSKLRKSEYETVLRTHETILQNIFKLEDMYEDGRVRQDTFTQKQMLKIRETKMEFIKRCYPSAEKTEFSTFPFAWVAVEYYLRDCKSVNQPTAEFEADDFSADQNVCFFGRWDRGWEIRHLSRDTKEKLLNILESCKSKLAKNYFELCIILITFKPPNALERALKVSQEWCKKHESDFLAHFMHGAFLLVKAITTENSEFLRLAKNSLDACNKATILQSTPDGVFKRRYGSTRPRFIIRQQTKSVVDMLGFFPRKQQHGEQKGNLRWRLGAYLFNGSLEENSELRCRDRILASWRFPVPPKSVSEEMMKKKLLVSFLLTLSFVGPVPIDIHRASM